MEIALLFTVELIIFLEENFSLVHNNLFSPDFNFFTKVSVYIA